MKSEMYTVYDSKAQVYGDPFHAPNDAVALRMFSAVCNDPATQLNKYPEDFALYNLGTYDASTAEFNTHNPRAITTAMAAKVMTNGQN